jgi:hypothetical protein
VRSLICLFLFASAAAAANPSLTVVLDYEQPHSRSSFDAMQSELTALLDHAGVSVNLKDKASLAPNTQFNDLVVFRMSGRCDATPVPLEALSDERGPLAMAYSSDGQILPFGEVKCDRIRQCLQRSIGRGLPSGHDRSAYGAALAKVMAHEIYHMLAHDPHHTHAGLTKEALSPHELLDNSMSLPDKALAEIRRSLSRQN